MPKKNSTFMVVLNWVLDNVIYGCIPLMCACTFKVVGNANIDLLKLTPDCLLIGFAISISAKSYVEEFDEAIISRELKRILGAVPFMTCIVCCLLYSGLFGEFSAFPQLGESDSLWLIIRGLGIAILINIGVIYYLQSRHDKKTG